jgi:hypothetical protein
VTLPIIGGDYGTLKRLVEASRAETLALRRMVVALQSRIEANEAEQGISILHASIASITLLQKSLIVNAGLTIDGRDISVDGTTLDTLGTTVGGHTTSIGILQTLVQEKSRIYIPITAFNNRDAKTISYSSNRASGQCTDATNNNRYYATWRIPDDFDAGTNLTARVHWITISGGTNGQDVAFRLTVAFTQDGETAATGGTAYDLTADCPDVTAEECYVNTISSAITGAVAGDCMTLFLQGLRAVDPPDSHTGVIGIVGLELSWTTDLTG